MRILRLAWGIVALLFSAEAALAAGVTEDGAVRLLDGHEFAGGSYAIIGLIWGPERYDIQRELGNFYVDDVDLLNRLKDDWVTGGPAPFYACGYHYTILVVDRYTVLDRFGVNFETDCGSIVTEHGSNHFDATLLTKHADGYRRPRVEELTFDSLAEGRAHLASIAGDQRLLLAPEPEWREYDGEFRFRADCPGHDFNSANLQACLNWVRSEIGADFPGEPFDVAEAGSGGDGHILIEMKCRKSLHAGFDLYEDYYEWRDYEPTVTLYWKEAG